MAFILMLAMVITSLGISGWGTDQVYAAEGAGTATVRIVGPDNQFVITEASIEIDSGVTTLGAVVAQACAEQGLNFQLKSDGYPGIIGDYGDLTGYYWMSMLNDSMELGGTFNDAPISDESRIVIYYYNLERAYSQFTVLTHSAITTSPGTDGNVNLSGTVTLNLKKNDGGILSDSKSTVLDIANLYGNVMDPTDDYSFIQNPNMRPITGSKGNVSIELKGFCEADGVNRYNRTFIVTSENHGLVKPYLRIEMTETGLIFSQPIDDREFDMGDPFVEHFEKPDATVLEIIEGILQNFGAYSEQDYDYDWALGVAASGNYPSTIALNSYLKGVLSGLPTMSTAQIAKTAIALSSLGIDARYVPDKDTGEAQNLVKMVMDTGEISEWGKWIDDGWGTTGYNTANNAPFALSLYDLGIYEIPNDAALTREALIQNILDTVGDNYWGLYGPDGTGMVLPALAPYCTSDASIDGINGISAVSCQAITTLVDSAISDLSSKVGVYGGIHGGWSLSSDTQSMVLMGLHSLGINTHEGNFLGLASTLDNLLSYRTEDNGLSSSSNSVSNKKSSKTGLWALATYQNLMSDTGRSSNLYNFDTTVAQYTEWPDAKLLTGIQVFPDVTKYNMDETVNSSTLTVQAIYNGKLSMATTVSSEACTISIRKGDTSFSSFTENGTYTVTVEYKGERYSYTVLVGSKENNQDAAYISASIRAGGTTIASEELLIENGKTTALEALITLAGKAGVGIVVRGGYVSQINGLGEFDKGDNSGWLYRIGNQTPELGAGFYKLQAGDELVWYYTLDYTKDSGSSKWAKDEEKASELVAKEDGKGSATVEVTKADMDKLIKDGGTLKAKSSIATIELDAATLKGLGNQMSKDLEIKATRVDISQREDISQAMKDKIGDRPVLDLTVMSGTKQISKFDGSVRVSIPYTLKQGEEPSTIVLYLLKDSGEIEIIKNAAFDPLTGEVIFTTSHFSLYGIGYRALTFSDISGHWAKDYITYLAARDYITGMSKDNFDPNGTLTRGQFVQLLANLANVDLKKYGSTEPSSINDVKLTDWFAPAVAWAVEQGIVTGIALPDGTTSFYPEKSISRQDIAVMLNRYRAKIDKKEFSEAVKEKAFQDKDQIGGYAVESVKTLQKSGIIQGKSETTFAPLDQAKRGEAAKMIHGMLKLN